jgi:DNA polymerase-3 subunit gamma/tau
MSSDAPIAPSNVTPINARSGSVGSLALAPEPVVAEPESVLHTEAPIAAVPTAAIAEPTTDDLARAQHAACDALADKFGMAAHSLEESEWTMAGHELRIQTTQPKPMMSIVFTPDVERVIKASLRTSGLGAFKLVLLAGEPAAAKMKKPRAPRAGSVDAKAREHPLVQHAQKLFNAEVLSVQDLRKD